MLNVIYKDPQSFLIMNYNTIDTYVDPLPFRVAKEDTTSCTDVISTVQIMPFGRGKL